MGLEKDSLGRIWTTKGDQVYVFNGSVTNHQQPDYVIPPTIPLRFGGQITSGTLIGLAYDESNDALWVSDTENHRVVRIHYPLNEAKREVDVVLGQPNLEPHPGVNYQWANRGMDNPFAPKPNCLNMVPDGFGFLGSLELDNYGNLYIVDGIHEGWGCSNNRVLEYESEDLVPHPAKNFFAQGERVPKRVYGGSGFTKETKNIYQGPDNPFTPISVSFSKNNEMLMTVDAYGNPYLKRVFWYDNPIPECGSPCRVEHSLILPIAGAQLSSSSWDKNDNLAILDHTWNRVLLLNVTLIPPIITPTPPTLTPTSTCYETVIENVDMNSEFVAYNLSKTEGGYINFTFFDKRGNDVAFIGDSIHPRNTSTDVLTRSYVPIRVSLVNDIRLCCPNYQGDVMVVSHSFMEYPGPTPHHGPPIAVDTHNDPPVFNPIGDKTVGAGDLLEFSILAGDRDDPSIPWGQLEYSMIAKPEGASFNPQTRIFSWTPTLSDIGNHKATFQVQDKHLDLTVGNIVQETIAIKVTSPAPTVIPTPIPSPTNTPTPSLTPTPTPTPTLTPTPTMFPKQITVVDDIGDVGLFNSIAIGADGNPVISYYNRTNEDLKFVKCGNPACSSGNIIRTVNGNHHVVKTASSIAIGTDGNPAISYYEWYAGANGGLTVSKCRNSACSVWNKELIDNEGSVGWESSIIIGTDGNPVISYFDYTNYNLKVAKCRDNLCFSGNTITTVDSEGHVGRYTSIAIGTDKKPIISYTSYDQRGDGDLKVAKCGDNLCSSGNTITTVDSEGGVGWNSSIAIGKDENPVISYYDGTNRALKVAKIFIH